MKADSQRQWFVYFNEKEMGPFFEPDLLTQLKSGELDNTAYVFTEGMTDWSLVNEVQVLVQAQREPETERWRDQPSLPGASRLATPPAEAQPAARDFSTSQPSQVSQVSRATRAPAPDPVRDFVSPQPSVSSAPPQAGASSRAAPEPRPAPEPAAQGGFAARPESSKVSQVSRASQPTRVGEPIQRESISSPAAARSSGGESVAARIGAEAARHAAEMAALRQQNSGSARASSVADATASQPVDTLSAPASEKAAKKEKEKPEKKPRAPKPPRQPIKLNLPPMTPRTRAIAGGVVVLGLLAVAAQQGFIPGIGGGSHRQAETAPEGDPTDAPPDSGAPAAPPPTGDATADAPPPVAAPTTTTRNSPPGATPGAVGDVDWTELRALRESKDPKSAPYRLASKTVGSRFPIVLGVLSSQLKADVLHVAVFPDNERNLMAVPRLWFLTVPLIDGYFAVGPLNLDGNELPAGRYNILVQAGPNFLGQTAFEVGNYPAGAKLSEAQQQMATERTQLAERERASIDLKLKEVNAALDQLKGHSQYANKGARGAADWKRVSKPWRDSLTKARDDQIAVMSGAMFYPQTQANLYQFIDDMNTLYESLEIFSKGGVKLLAKTRKKGLGQMWAEIAQKQASLTGEVKSLAQVAPKPLNINIDAIKAQLATVATQK